MFLVTRRALFRPHLRYIETTPAYSRFPEKDQVYFALQRNVPADELYKVTRDIIDEGNKVDGRLLAGVMRNLKDPKQLEDIFQLAQDHATQYPLPAKFFSQSMRSFARTGMRERALEIFLQLPDKFSVIPDVDTMNTALMLYFVKGQTDEAMKIWDEIRKSGREEYQQPLLFHTMIKGLHNVNLTTCVALLDTMMKEIKLRTIHTKQKFTKKSYRQLASLGTDKLQTLARCLEDLHRFSARILRSSKGNPDALDVYEKAQVLTNNCEELGLKIFQVMKRQYTEQGHRMSRESFQALFRLTYRYEKSVKDLLEEMIVQGVEPTSETISTMLEMLSVTEAGREIAQTLLDKIDFSLWPADAKTRKIASHLGVTIPGNTYTEDTDSTYFATE